MHHLFSPTRQAQGKMRCVTTAFPLPFSLPFPLPFHCCSTAVPLLFHCLFTAFLLPFYCCSTAFRLDHVSTALLIKTLPLRCVFPLPFPSETPPCTLCPQRQSPHGAASAARSWQLAGCSETLRCAGCVLRARTRVCVCARVSLTLRLICGYLLRSLLPFLTCIYETLFGFACVPCSRDRWCHSPRFSLVSPLPSPLSSPLSSPFSPLFTRQNQNACIITTPWQVSVALVGAKNTEQVVLNSRFMDGNETAFCPTEKMICRWIRQG